MTMEYSPSIRFDRVQRGGKYKYKYKIQIPGHDHGEFTIKQVCKKVLKTVKLHACSFSRVYGYPSIELRPGGGDESVTVHNVEEFVERTVDWALYRSYYEIFSQSEAG